ncbi:MAG: hypothetical protein RR547_03280 [Raoultibacter sp.]
MSDKKPSPRYYDTVHFFRAVEKAIYAKEAAECLVVANQETLTLNGVSGGEHVAKTMEGDITERGMARLWESIDHLDDVLIDYCDLIDGAMEIMDKLDNPMMYAIVKMRYIDHMRPALVARKLYISTRQETRLHTQAMYILYSPMTRWRKMACK